jgi:hypothetical protein
MDYFLWLVILHCVSLFCISIIFLFVDFCRDKKKVKPVIAGQLSSNKNQLDEENPTKDTFVKAEMDFSELANVDRNLKNVEMDAASESKNAMTGQVEEFTNNSGNVNTHSSDIETATDFQTFHFEISATTLSSASSDDDPVDYKPMPLDSKQLLDAFDSVSYDSQKAVMLNILSQKSGFGIDSINKLDANMTAALLKTLRMEAEVLTDELGLSEDPDSLFKDFNKLVNACSALQLDDTQLSGIETVEEDELPSYIREEDNLSFSSEEDNVPLSQNNKSIIDLPSSRSSRSIHDQKIAGSELSWVAHRKDYF